MRIELQTRSGLVPSFQHIQSGATLTISSLLASSLTGKQTPKAVSYFLSFQIISCANAKVIKTGEINQAWGKGSLHGARAVAFRGSNPRAGPAFSTKEKNKFTTQQAKAMPNLWLPRKKVSAMLGRRPTVPGARCQDGIHKS